MKNTSPFTIIDNLLETSKERESKKRLFQQVQLQQYEPSEKSAFLGGCCGLWSMPRKSYFKAFYFQQQNPP